MSTRYCCVYGCLKTKETNPECSFIKLPNDVNRQHEWLKIIGRPDLIYRSHINPKSYHVCSSHFEDEDLKRVTLLFPDAVPSRYLPEGRFIVDWDDPHLANNPNHPGAQLEFTEDPLLGTENIDDDLTNNALGPNVPILQDELTINMRKLAEAQSKLDQDRSSKEFLSYALNLYLLNPQVYRFIREALDLPSEKIFRKMNLNLSPKLDSRILGYLSSKLKSFPDKAKFCTICIEPLYVRSSLYYDILSDELVGFQEVGNAKSDEAAGIVYVLMLRSILVNWDQPVSYCFLAGVKGYSQLEAWIDGVIISLLEIGFEVMALVTNQGNNFKKFATEIKGITPEQHYFTVNNKKIYYIFEVPQLVKVIRNNLGTKDIYINNKRVSWQYIELLFELESKKKHKIIPKITSGHVSLYNITKMPSVRYAAEVFSNTVSKAINTYVDTQELPEEARETANFCVFMNNLFDVLNSSTYKNDNVYKCALGSHKSQMELLREALDVFSTIKWKPAKHGKGNKRYPQCARPQSYYSLPSVQVSLNSIISISQDLTKLGHSRILTERLNLDPLEKFADLVRHVVSKTNDAAKPTAIEFRRNFSRHFKKQILTKTPLSNRPNAFRKYFEDATRLDTSKIQNVSSRSLVWLDGCTDYRIQLPFDHPTIYIASYIFYKCHESHKCAELDRYANKLPDLAKTKVYEVFNKKAAFYGKLKLLHYPFIRFIEQLDQAFMLTFKNCISSNPGTQLFSDLRNVSFDPPCVCFPKLYATKLLVRLRIYTTIKSYNNVLRHRNINLCEYISELKRRFQVIQ